jgi:hypothetical protein
MRVLSLCQTKILNPELNRLAQMRCAMKLASDGERPTKTAFRTMTCLYIQYCDRNLTKIQIVCSAGSKPNALPLAQVKAFDTR